MPTDFWETARTRLERIKPDIMLLAEASKPDLLVKAFDVDYGWPLMHALDDVLLKGAPASNLRASWEQSQRQFPRDTLHLQITDDHDEARAISRFGVRGALAASAFMFTMDGVPLLYNGMEVGDATESGDPALFDKLPVFWSPKERPHFREIYRGLIQLRKEWPALRGGRVVWLPNSNEESLVSFKRADEHNEFAVVINFSNRPLTGRVEVNNCDEFKPLRIPGMPAVPDQDFPLVHLGGFDWRVYQRSLAAVNPATSDPAPVQVGSARP